jgi:hypothetical protein
MAVAVAVVAVVMLVPVVPQLGFVEQKEKNQPNQQSHEQIVRTGLALKGFGQQMHKGCGQQRACCQTEHVLGVAGQNTKAQQSRQPHTANAGG